MAEAPRVASPCVGLCALNIDDICTGCGRTPEEIGAWGSLDNAERQVVLRRAEQRAAQWRAASVRSR